MKWMLFGIMLTLVVLLLTAYVLTWQNEPLPPWM